MSSPKRSPITSHILDLANGKAAANVSAVLERGGSSGWAEIGKSKTNQDGRIEDFLPAGTRLEPGIFRIRFDLLNYLGSDSFYPYAEIVFQVKNPSEHYHIPLLLSPFGYSTYRGT